MQASKKIKPSQKVLSFLRQEREKGRECFVIHRSERGLKEIDLRNCASFNKRKPSKTGMIDGVLEEDEFEDLSKVYDQVKAHFQATHNSDFRLAPAPTAEEKRKIAEALANSKLKKPNANGVNWQQKFKQIREQSLQFRGKNKSGVASTADGTPIELINRDIELHPRDVKLLSYYHEPYAKETATDKSKSPGKFTSFSTTATPKSKASHTLSVSERIAQYNSQKVFIEKYAQKCHKFCTSAIKNELAKGKQETPNAARRKSSFHSSGGGSEQLQNHTIYNPKNSFLDNYNIAERQTVDKRIASQKDCNVRCKTEGEDTDVEALTIICLNTDEKSEDIKSSSYQEENEFFMSEGTTRKKMMISMVSGKPMRAYLQLNTLAEKIVDKGKESNRLKEKNRRCEESLLRQMDEFKDFQFAADINQINVTHSNITSQLHLSASSTAAHGRHMSEAFVGGIRQAPSSSKFGSLGSGIGTIPVTAAVTPKASSSQHSFSATARIAQRFVSKSTTTTSKKISPIKTGENDVLTYYGGNTKGVESPSRGISREVGNEQHRKDEERERSESIDKKSIGNNQKDMYKQQTTQYNKSQNIYESIIIKGGNKKQNKTFEVLS